jgi:hypothetical protein
MSKLIFPELTPLGSKDKRTGRLVYQLNWARKSAAHPKGGQELPNELRFDMDAQVYGISHEYLVEINRACDMTLVERCIPRPFDTVIRDACLKPSEAFVEVHFRLITDCLMEVPRHSRTRTFDKNTILPLMLYRFWQFQTGCGLPWSLSGFQELEDRIARDGHKVPASTQDIVQEMKEHNESIINALQERCEATPA